MKFSRRLFLNVAAGATALPAVSRIAQAQTYPMRPVRIIVGFAAGSTSDIIARLMGQWLSERLGQQFIVENRPGAGSNIATEAVVKASPDGYTLLFITPSNAISSIEHIRAGKLRPLAVTTASLTQTLPNVPTINDFLPGYEASSWYGIGVPANTPQEIVDRLNNEINAGLSDSRMKTRLADLGGSVIVGSPAEFGNFITDETERWGKVVKFSGAKPD